MSAGSGAVFLSYASEDSGTASSIADAFASAGVEVWFDKSELRGGDAWDQKIRRQIRECRLFIPIVSAHTQQRPEGYFRLEWKLAVDRSHLMATELAYLIPVVIDDVSDAEALVPDRFREVQWTRLSNAQSTQRFVERVVSLLQGGPPAKSSTRTNLAPISAPEARSGQRKFWLTAAGVTVGLFAIFGWISWRHLATQSPAAGVVAGTKSIAVMPFVDLSERHDQEYFADGMAEEILDELTKVPQLKVISRTTSFQYKGRGADVRAIGSAIGARYVVEGTVRRSGNQVRITARLIDAADGSETWSERYDRDFGDVLKVQDQIAAALVRALEVSVGAFERAPRTTLRVPAAYEAYLRARKANDRFDRKGMEEATDYYREALRLDPEFARAASALAMLQTQIGIWGYQPPSVAFAEAVKTAERATQLDPSLAEPHAAIALSRILNDWDWMTAEQEIARAEALDPHDLSTEFAAAWLAEVRGDWREAQHHVDSGLGVDPLNAQALYLKGEILLAAGLEEDAEAAVRRGLQISPGYNWLRYLLARVLVARNRAADALIAIQDEADPEGRLYGLALGYFANGQRAEADRALKTLIAQASDWPSGIASVYAFRGEADEAFRWLARAYDERDVDLALIKSRVEFKLLSKDPRYAAMLRKLKLPD